MAAEMKRPAEHAAEAAEAIRALNHATLRKRDQGGGWEYPSDAYDVIGELSRVAMYLPQAVQQAGKFVDAFEKEGRLGVDSAATMDVEASQVALGAALVDASAAAEVLAHALMRAHGVASHLTYRITGETERAG